MPRRVALHSLLPARALAWLCLVGLSFTGDHAGAAASLRLSGAQVVDREGKPIPGFTFADTRPITRDGLAVPLTWKKPLSDLAAKPIRLELALRRARLFAIEVQH